jgi:hypothetical protein
MPHAPTSTATGALSAATPIVTAAASMLSVAAYARLRSATISATVAATPAVAPEMVRMK